MPIAVPSAPETADDWFELISVAQLRVTSVHADPPVVGAASRYLHVELLPTPAVLQAEPGDANVPPAART